LPAHIREELALYGLQQRLSDYVASVKNPSQKMAGMRELYEVLRAGQWSPARRSSGIDKQRIKALLEEGRIEEALRLLS